MQAKKLDYNFSNYRTRYRRRMERVYDGTWTTKQWYEAERLAARRFVMRIVKIVESFE